MDIEAQTLAYSPEQMEVDAGIEVFNQYGALNTLETLSGGDILKYELVKGLMYDEVYTKLLMNKDKRIFEKNYRDIVTENSKEK